MVELAVYRFSSAIAVNTVRPVERFVVRYQVQTAVTHASASLQQLLRSISITPADSWVRACWPWIATNIHADMCKDDREDRYRSFAFTQLAV